MENIPKIVESVMGGKMVRIEVESDKDDEIRSFIGNLKKLSPGLRANCNVTTLPENVMKATIDLTLVEKADWLESSLKYALTGTMLTITVL